MKTILEKAERNKPPQYLPKFTAMVIRYDTLFALENGQASCQFNLAHELKEN